MHTYDCAASQTLVRSKQVSVNIANAAILEQVRLERPQGNWTAWEHHICPLDYESAQLLVLVAQHRVGQQIICHKQQQRQQTTIA